MDGSALDVNVGPFQLVVEGEPRPARTIRMVARTVSRHDPPKNPDQRDPICLDDSSRSSKGVNGQSRTKREAPRGTGPNGIWLQPLNLAASSEPPVALPAL